MKNNIWVAIGDLWDSLRRNFPDTSALQVCLKMVIDIASQSKNSEKQLVNHLMQTLHHTDAAEMKFYDFFLEHILFYKDDAKFDSLRNEIITRLQALPNHQIDKIKDDITARANSSPITSVGWVNLLINQLHTNSNKVFRDILVHMVLNGWADVRRNIFQEFLTHDPVSRQFWEVSEALRLQSEEEWLEIVPAIIYEKDCVVIHRPAIDMEPAGKDIIALLTRNSDIHRTHGESIKFFAELTTSGKEAVGQILLVWKEIPFDEIDPIALTRLTTELGLQFNSQVFSGKIEELFAAEKVPS